MDSASIDGALRRSHDDAVALVGREVGEPGHADRRCRRLRSGAQAVPRGDDAVRVFDRRPPLGGYPEVVELKRTRVRPPVLT